MKLYFRVWLMLMQKYLLRRSTGRVICDFAEKMGVVYIKMAQILAMQNVGKVFTEADRLRLSQICDHCQPIPYTKIAKILQQELSLDQLAEIKSIDHEPLGSASISQVHRATLVNGDEIVLKIKRRDITKDVEHDIKQLKHLIHRFGRFTPLRNLIGSDKALSLWADWIYQETDFQNEQKNLEHYQGFCRNVNGRIRGTKHLQVPRVYPQLCTQNIIAMECIAAPTINKMELNAENKALISRGLNDYISLSFWALLHSQAVVFHGDPHSGNIYIDKDGNVGFLDMGLVFAFDGEEAEYVRSLFLNAYMGKATEIVDMLIARSQYTTYNRAQLIADVELETAKFRQVSVTQFFINMINTFTRYDIAPPELLFKMAKAFLAIFGINNFVGNSTDVESLLSRQIVEFYLQRTCNDLRGLPQEGVGSMVEIIKTCAGDGLLSGCSSAIISLDKFSQDCQATLTNGRELLTLIRRRAAS